MKDSSGIVLVTEALSIFSPGATRKSKPNGAVIEGFSPFKKDQEQHKLNEER